MKPATLAGSNSELLTPRTDWVPLKHACRVNCDTLPEDFPGDHEIRYLDISGVDGLGGHTEPEVMSFEEAPSRARRIVRDGDVLVSTVRTYLRAITHIPVAGDDFICSTGFAVLTANHEVDPRFLFYWTRSEPFVGEVVSRSVGVSYPAINPSELVKLPFPNTPRSTQERIAQFLDHEISNIDDLIAKKQRLIELLGEKRAALISRAVTHGLDPSVQTKDSRMTWIGSIPSHWRMMRLRHLSPRVGVGLVINPSTYTCSEGVPFIFGSNVLEFGFKLEGVRMISAADSRRLPASLLHEGDLVTVRVGYPGVTAVVPAELESANCASVMIVRRGPKFISEWLCYAMNSRLASISTLPL